MKDKNLLIYLAIGTGIFYFLRNSKNTLDGVKTYSFEYLYNGEVIDSAIFTASNLKLAKAYANRYKRMDLTTNRPLNKIVTRYIK